jgi:hypothetical protein
VSYVPLKKRQRRGAVGDFMTPYEKKGISGKAVFTSITCGDLAPSMMYTEMGVTNEAVTTLVTWIDTRKQPVSDTEKRARALQLDTSKELLAKKETLSAAKEEFTEVLKQLRRDRRIFVQERLAAKYDADIEQCDLKIILADVELDEIQEFMSVASDDVSKANYAFKISKTELAKLRLARGCPEESFLSQIESF